MLPEGSVSEPTDVLNANAVVDSHRAKNALALISNFLVIDESSFSLSVFAHSKLSLQHRTPLKICCALIVAKDFCVPDDCMP